MFRIVFFGLLIISVQSQPTSAPEDITSSPEEVEFKALYQNVTDEIQADYVDLCGIEQVEEENMKNPEYVETYNLTDRSWTSMTREQFWKNAVVPWSFVSVGDDYAKYAVHTDSRTGLTKMDVDTVMAAQKQIEAATCIRFNMVRPVKGQPWLFISRDSKHSDMTCNFNYIKDTYVGKDVAGVGDIYRRLGYSRACFPGAYAWYGEDSPQNFVISKTRVDNRDQNSIGLVVHELLHNLGVGHTQKRQDALQHITINWNNIARNSHSQYEPCVEEKDYRCSRYNDYGTPYDCMSIMHYRDTFFLTREAGNRGAKTMTAKRPSCDLKSHANRLSQADIDILTKMYCKDKVQENVIKSPNHPANYPDNANEEYPVSVEAGSVISLWFTEFKIESERNCRYDSVKIIDGDGTVLLPESCGTNKPARITSKTNRLKVLFKSDGNTNFAGFRAEWKKVEAAPTPVDGGWSQWSGFSQCSNGQDGKSVCRKKRLRFCNDPAPSNGGKNCPGESELFENCIPVMTNPDRNPNCVLHGGWSAWSKPSDCSAACRTTKTRKCENPLPINGKACRGEDSESSECTGGSCPSSTKGIIKSTNYPANYPDNHDKEYPLEVESGSSIHLEFKTFDVEPSEGCVYDYVKIMDGETEIAKYCGNTLPPHIHSSTNKLLVVFHSDGDVNKKGFEAEWEKSTGVISGQVMSPNFPSNYPNNERYVKTLNVPEGETIELKFTDFKIEALIRGGKLESCYDKLTIYDGPMSSANKIKELCGETIPDTIISTKNSMTLVFTSDGSVVFKGFKATWKQI